MLDSPFATLFGFVPLPALGFAAYAAVAAASAKLAASSSSSREVSSSSGGSGGGNDDDDDENENENENENNNNKLAASVVAAGAGALGAASLSLVFLLTGTDAFPSGASCAWCYASAALSAAIVAATFLPMSTRERGGAAAPALLSTSASAARGHVALSS